jgi:tryptophan-rich sensory protein
MCTSMSKIFKSRAMFSIVMLLFNIACFANDTYDEYSEYSESEEGPDPPPAAPIDNHIWILIALAILIGIYFLYKRKKENVTAC